MSQQQPGWGAPQQPYPTAPQPPRKKAGAGKILGFGCLGVIALLVLIGIAVAVLGGSGSDTGAADGPAASRSADAGGAEAGKTPAKQAAAEEFKAFVAENGTSKEQEAVQHVTKVQGADEQNDILDSVDIHTDYTGGMMGPHAADGKLLASAFADWKDSKNGLVTVYDADGEILSNGNF